MSHHQCLFHHNCSVTSVQDRLPPENNTSYSTTSLFSTAKWRMPYNLFLNNHICWHMGSTFQRIALPAVWPLVHSLNEGTLQWVIYPQAEAGIYYSYFCSGLSRVLMLGLAKQCWAQDIKEAGLGMDLPAPIAVMGMFSSGRISGGTALERNIHSTVSAQIQKTFAKNQWKVR